MTLLARGCHPRGQMCHCGFFCSGYTAHPQSRVRHTVGNALRCTSGVATGDAKVSFESLLRGCDRNRL